MRRILVGFALASVAVGLAATAFWLWTGREAAQVELPLRVVIPVVGAVCVLSTLNLALRWLRWHFLTRRVIRALPTRSSLVLYFGTLAAFATPLYLGELLRSALAARRMPNVRRAVFAIWVLERMADVAVLVAFVLAAQGRWRLAAGLGMAGVVVWAVGRRGLSSRSARALTRPTALAGVALTSAVAWSMAVAGLWLIAAALGERIEVATAAQAFSLGTLLGGLSLLPLGTGVAGSSMIVELDRAGMEPAATLAAVALFRAATAWYTLALGGLAALRWRRQLLAAVREPRPPQQHFNDLAAEYGDQIPEAVRDRVVGRKIEAMQAWMGAVGISATARGLDVGCGPGWYAAEMARAGYAMDACDRSTGQLGEAKRFLTGEGVEVDLAVADARALPYPNERFDFAYAVNVLHHVTDPEGRERALREIVRVLKPGGSFFLHEINTDNPVFAFYMGYMFPLLRDIDDGTELWIKPSGLPEVNGARWDSEQSYFTFLPDFIPRPLLKLFSGLERALERSRLRRWSAHFVARLVREDPGPRPGSEARERAE